LDLEVYEACQKIRLTEESLLSLFSSGKMNGTIHTCVGQELASYYVIESLQAQDAIFSNHRCHGHYIHRFNDHSSLIAELMGKRSGVCSGIGSSQHICRDNFFSNGLQGGITPLAAGHAYKAKLNNENSISLVFIGDGTLGEGVVYETLNISSLLGIPLLIVCEDNGFAQSTKKENSFRGSLEQRVLGFGAHYIHTSMWDENDLSGSSKIAVNYVRKNSKPCLLHIDTYRLNSHSKSDDNRDKEEIESYRHRDPLIVFSAQNPDITADVDMRLQDLIDKCIADISLDEELTIEDYLEDHFSQIDIASSEIKYPVGEIELSNHRIADRVNFFLHEALEKDNRVVIIGEDITDPYGGAFKITKGLSSKHPNRVFSTPISEQAITGLSNGLAISGMKPYLEIMFSDFITLCMDQIINHASKFYYMYNKQVTCPIVIRTPVGGGRGYGPTHSQAMEKFLIGIDTIRVIAINAFIDPFFIYTQIHRLAHPVIVIENKAGYGRYMHKETLLYSIKNEQKSFGNTIVHPNDCEANITILTYGENASRIYDKMEELFDELDAILELHVINCLYPLNIDSTLDSLNKTQKLLIVEESSVDYGIGSEVAALVHDKLPSVKIKRLGAMSIPIPSIRSLEEEVLQFNKVKQSISELLNNGA